MAVSEILTFIFDFCGDNFGNLAKQFKLCSVFQHSFRALNRKNTGGCTARRHIVVLTVVSTIKQVKADASCHDSVLDALSYHIVLR